MKKSSVGGFPKTSVFGKAPLAFIGMGMLLLCMGPLQNGFAQNEEPHAAGVIVGFEVVGLKRTKNSVVQKALEKFIGQKSDEIDLPAVHAALMETGILDPENVEIRDGGGDKILFVEVVEKWTILPLPMFMADTNGYISGGLFVMDMNVFGINDKFSLGGIYGTGGGMAMLFYAHSGRKTTLPDWSIAAVYTFGENKITDQKSNILCRWNAHVIRGAASLGYSFLGDRFKTSLDFGFNDNIPAGPESGFLPPEKPVMRISLSPGLDYYQSSFDGFLMESQSFSLSYTTALGIGGDTVQSIEFKGLFEKSMLPGFKLIFSFAAGHTFHADRFTLLHPSFVVPILPASYGAKTFFAAQDGIEKYLFRWKYGTLSVKANYQIVESESPGLGWNFDHGPGAAISFFLSRIALPAVSITFNYNIPKQHFVSGFSMGMSF
ncbi:MAG: hypothetical protein LBC60_05330 [Spirochaetaceae bacterium]|jgi:hypothetical protein|nr:hypothetical protein [Spirochaetaceae bacterium]